MKNIFLSKENGGAVFNARTGKMLRYFDGDAHIIENYLKQEYLAWSGENHYMAVMYKNGLLVDFDLDEIGEMEQREQDGSFGDCLRLILLPTEQCNFRCVYCYEKFERGRMSETTQDAIVEYIQENINRYKGLIVNWFGGEPTEAMDIIENLSLRLIEVCKKNKKAYNAGITTNGYNLTLENFKKLKKFHVTEYQIIIDGLENIHNAQRMMSDGSPTFDVIMKNLFGNKKQYKIFCNNNCSKNKFQ